MPVVINEFEVVPEPASPSAPSAAAPPGQPVLDPAALERFLATQRARDQRVRAY